MDWFEKLTGFRETSYDDTRAKLHVEGTQLQSLVNGNGTMAREQTRQQGQFAIAGEAEEHRRDVAARR